MPERLDDLRSQFAAIDHQIGTTTALTTTDRIFQILRQAIADLVLKPRETLSEKELAVVLGVSKTPVREALIRLAMEGLVLTLPRSSTFVAPIDPDDLFEAMIIRDALETTAVRLAARRIDHQGKFHLRENMQLQRDAGAGGDVAAFHRADDELHRLFVKHSGLRRLMTMLDTVRLTLNRVRHLATPVPGRIALLTEQHQRIVDAVVNNDDDGAVMTMRAHLDALTPFVEALLRDRPELFATSTRSAARTRPEAVLPQLSWAPARGSVLFSAAERMATKTSG